eukprot:scaffold115639_cov29-Attheya_sp.AAC.1
MESLQTESVGMLSLTLFLLNYCKYHSIDLLNPNLCHYCDNSTTVVKHTKWYKERDICAPNMHLSLDDNVEVQIDDTMIQLKTTFITEWVKGHQTPKAGEELPWEATLNIEVDQLANEAREGETAGQDDNFYQQYPCKPRHAIHHKANQ